MKRHLFYILLYVGLALLGWFGDQSPWLLGMFMLLAGMEFGEVGEKLAVRMANTRAHNAALRVIIPAATLIVATDEQPELLSQREDLLNSIQTWLEQDGELDHA